MRTIISAFICLLGLLTQAQNLVLNPFFIPHKNSKTEAQLYLVPGYSNPNQGTTDFYSRTASKYEVGIPQNFVGWQEINGTDHYCGIIAYYADQTRDLNQANKGNIGYGKYAEYLQVHLREPLKAGEKYKVSFESSLAETSGYSCILGAYFSNNQLDIPNNEKLSFTPQISSGTLLGDKVLWTKTTGYYTAAGGEAFLIIGRYAEEVKVVVPTNSNNNLRAYYYLSNVEVVNTKSLIDKDLPSAETEELVNDSKGSFNWPILTFETNKSTVNAVGMKELKRVSVWMKAHPKTIVLVSGHTDRIGNEAYNVNLSKQRAEAVKAQLIKLGVSPSAVETESLGFSSPAVSEGPNANSKNRRVTLQPKK